MTVHTDAAAAVPADVLSAAYARDLGGHRESYPAVTSKQGLFGLGGFAGLFGIFAGIITVAALNIEDPEGVAATAATISWLVTAPFLGGFLWLLLCSPAVSNKARQFRVHVFEHGWVWVRRKGTEVYRWDEVQTLFSSMVVLETAPGISTTAYDSRITCVDGRQTRIRQVHVDMARFGPLLAAQVAKAQLPKAMAHFDKGNPVGFGDLTVTEDGVTTRNGKLLPWSEIGGVEMLQTDQCYLCLVDRRGRQLGPRVNFGLMANGHTFVLMVDAILTKLRGAGQ